MRGSSFECQRHMNVSNYVFDPCMVLLASKAPLLVFRLWPSGAITHGGPSSHSSSLSAQLFSQRSFLGQIAWTSMAPFPQIYWFTANLSIIHIPNYRLQSAGWRQQHKEGRGRVKEREGHAVILLYHHISRWIQRICLTLVQSVSVLLFKETLQSAVPDDTHIIKC